MTPWKTIKTAYDAFWFLSEHPKFQYREARLLHANEKPKLSKRERIIIYKDETPWLAKEKYRVLEYPLKGESFPQNLDIHYTKVDKNDVVNSDWSKNINVACWLEFGPMKYVVCEGELILRHSHDPRLDCGGPTFEAALVELAQLVKKYYGNYKAPRWLKEDCG